MLTFDIVTIFPDYFAPLDLSLVGKARASAGGLAGATCAGGHTTGTAPSTTPLRRRCRDGDETRAVGRAFDELLAGPTPTLVVPPRGSCSGRRRRTSWWRRSGSCSPAAGTGDRRPGGRVRPRMPVREVSLGDYVLNGGEVAVLAMIEAIVRLIPGVLGNPESLVEESHAGDGLLEYPVYTKPQVWRGLEVPEILLSGHHAAIAGWRREQSENRTAHRRPDLLG